ncbi:MAG: M20/M25/M40 family metallo-hydrolase [Bryobacteraceae bacterium]|nr:M20/M25/M40 family metallo-hydrolase [Bryobacteraceae bacterium]
MRADQTICRTSLTKADKLSLSYWVSQVFLLLLTASLCAAQGPRDLAREIFRELVEIDTTQRNGSTKAALAMANRLKAAGLPVELAGPRPEKMNIVARLKGSTNAKPVLFIAHLDVVEARPADWSSGLDPFIFTERDGYFYGRGTTDVKDEAAILVANFIRLRREGYVPRRDLILALTADEEGGPDNGVAWLLKQHRDWIEAEWCINTDAGGGLIERGQRLRYTFQTSEKASANFLLTVKNPGGHSSQPVKENAIYRLAEGLARLAKFDFPIEINETTRSFFERMSTREASPAVRADMKAVSGSQPDLAAAERLAQGSTMLNSILRTTCVATTVEAGHARNALPQSAVANVNCRVLPGVSRERVVETLTRVVADPLVGITPLGTMEGSPASPLNPTVFGMVEKLVGEMYPGLAVVPVMDPWASDSAELRRAGIPTYGAPAVFFNIDPIRAHGQDERIGVEAFYEGLEFMHRLLRTL